MRSSERSTCNMPLISSERAGWEKSNSGYRHRALERLNDSAKVTQLKAVGLGLGSSFCPFVLPCCLPGGRTEAGSGEVGIVGLCLTASFSHTLPQKQSVPRMSSLPRCHFACPQTPRVTFNVVTHEAAQTVFQQLWSLPGFPTFWVEMISLPNFSYLALFCCLYLDQKGLFFFPRDGSTHWAAQALLKQFPATPQTPFLRSQPHSACHSPLHSFLRAAHYLCLLAQMACLCKWRPSLVVEFLSWTE